MKIVKLMFTFCCYGDVDVYVMKMAKLPSPMLASVTMCNDKIVELNSKINRIRWFGISYTCLIRCRKFYGQYIWRKNDYQGFSVRYMISCVNASDTVKLADLCDYLGCFNN